MHHLASQPEPHPDSNPALLYRGMILAGVIFSLIYATIAMFQGYTVPIKLMAGPVEDLFADYFKFITSFPGGDKVVAGSFFGLAEFPIPLPKVNPFLGIEALPDGETTHLHAMPLMTLFCLLSLRAMAWIGGVGCFVVTYALLAGYWIKVASGWAMSRGEAWTWMVIAALSYPTLMIVARGNIYAGFTGVLLIHAMLLAQRRKAPVLAALLLALAVNIRPNAMPFLLPLLLFHWPHVRRMLPAFCLAGGVICIASLALANQIYPDYTLPNLLGGLKVYYNGYVVGNAGLAMGSSLYGAIKFFIGYRPGLDLATLLPSAAILLMATWGWMTGRLRDSAMLFLTTAAYCLGSSVIADYHLLVFIMPLMVSAREHLDRSTTPWTDRIAPIACCLMLVSKNFVFRGLISYQIVLNPLILLIASALVLFHAWRVPTRYAPSGARMIA